MRVIHLELDKMKTRASVHRYLQKTLSLPEHYGKNLDALYDCLSELSEDTELGVPAGIADAEKLGVYGVRLLKVLHDAAAANPCLHIREE